MSSLEDRQKWIIPALEEMKTLHETMNIQASDDEIIVSMQELPYDFTYVHFERFGWQIFLVPKERLIEDDFSHQLYFDLQKIADGYNAVQGITEKPEDVVFNAEVLYC